jgi:hypothetical protein
MHLQNHATIRDSAGNAVLEGTTSQGLCRLDCRVSQLDEGFVNNAAVGPSLELLHRRLGHPGMRATKELLNSNVVLALLHDEKACGEEYCAVCRNSKEHRASFPPSTNPPTTPLQIVHSDLMGPFRCRSSGEHTYTCSLYDQYTGYGEMYFLSAKSEANMSLRGAIYRWQRQTGLKMKVLRTDRGKEYEDAFQRILRREGIIHQRSAG